MAHWTRDGLIEHRKRMGWPDLSDAQLARIVDILNDALDGLESLGGTSWTEPEIRFSTVIHDRRSSSRHV